METLGHKKLSDSDFNTAMAGLDADGSGEVTFDEFMTVRSPPPADLLARRCLHTQGCQLPWTSLLYAVLPRYLYVCAMIYFVQWWNEDDNHPVGGWKQQLLDRAHRTQQLRQLFRSAGLPCVSLRGCVYASEATDAKLHDCQPSACATV